MINIPQNTQLSGKFIDLIRSFNELEYKLKYPNCEGYAEQRMVLLKFEQELIMRGFL